MALVFSSHANQSPQVEREVQRAFENNVTVIPFRVEDVLPSNGFEYYLGNIHWLDALTQPVDPHLERLAGSVQGLLLGREMPAGSSPRASAPAARTPSPRVTEVPRTNGTRKGRVAALGAGAAVLAALAFALRGSVLGHGAVRSASAAPSAHAGKPTPVLRAPASRTSAGRLPAGRPRHEPDQRPPAAQSSSSSIQSRGATAYGAAAGRRRARVSIRPFAGPARARMQPLRSANRTAQSGRTQRRRGAQARRRANGF